MQRYILDISYKGTNYHGWQKQKNTPITIQTKIEEAIKIITRKNINIYGSGRTDAGVHAKQQIAHLDLPKNIEINELFYKLNRILPIDIAVNAINKISNNDFHARFDAKERTYVYNIIQKKNPFFDDFALFCPLDLNINLLNKTALIIKQNNNFKSFSKSCSYLNYKCNIKETFWVKKNNKLKFVITANRFLRGMVRAIVGTALQVGKGNLSLDDFENIIKKKDRKYAKDSISAKGLCLYKVLYDNGPIYQ